MKYIILGILLFYYIILTIDILCDSIKSTNNVFYTKEDGLLGLLKNFIIVTIGFALTFILTPRRVLYALYIKLSK